MSKMYIINDHIIDLRNKRVSPFLNDNNKDKKSLAFVIINDDSTCIKDFISYCKELGLTVNDNLSFNTVYGDLITVGLSNLYDIAYLQREKLNELNYPWAYLAFDENLIKNRLRKISEEKKRLQSAKAARRFLGRESIIPTYRDLVAEYVGTEILDDEREGLIKEVYNTPFLSSMPSFVKIECAKPKMISPGFAKVGYNVVKVVEAAPVRSFVSHNICCDCNKCPLLKQSTTQQPIFKIVATL
jgi:hypothetical protein